MSPSSPSHAPESSGNLRIARWFLSAQRTLLIAGIVWCLVVEVGVRLLWSPDPVRAESATQARAHPYLGAAGRPGWSSPDGSVRHDRRGFRVTGSTPAADAVRLACIGGTATYGSGCSSNETTWPARLRAALEEDPDSRASSVDVFNAGFPGWTSFEVVLGLAFRVLDLEPDLVVLQVGSEDVAPALLGEPAGYDFHGRSVLRASRPAPLERWLRRSVTYRLVRGLLPFSRRTTEPFLDPSVLVSTSENEDPLRAGGVAERAVRDFERNLRTAIGIAREHGIQVALLPQFVDPTGVEGPTRVRLSTQLARAAERVAREYEVLWIEIDPAVTGDGGDDASAERLARAVARALRPVVDLLR